MPDTRPGIRFDEQGVCQACRANEKKDAVDWTQRQAELEQLCAKYRGKFGNGYDCIIAASAGKDSHFQTYYMKEVMKMNPVLVSVEDNFTPTKAGAHNMKNISEAFGVDLITLKPNLKLQKKIMRKTFEKYAKPTWIVDRLIYTYPIFMALKLQLPLVVYGENIGYEYGGADAKETPSAINQIKNGVASDIPWEELLDDEVKMKDLYLCEFPPQQEIEKLKLEPIYLSYFVRWNTYRNYIFSKSRGFHDLTHEWKRSQCVEDFNQIDSVGYITHAWMKYPKFGHATATDLASRFIRYGLITRKEGIKLVKEHDGNLDSLCVRDFCALAGYSEQEFWAIVDKFYNRDIFQKNEYGQWELKDPIWKQQ
jgi:N-acetyl sugar amidotransferase